MPDCAVNASTPSPGTWFVVMRTVALRMGSASTSLTTRFASTTTGAPSSTKVGAASPEPITTGASGAAVIVVRSSATPAEIGVFAPFAEASTRTRSAPAVKPPDQVSSSARTVSGSTGPKASAAGRKRSRAFAASTRPSPLAQAMSTGCQFAPASVEYCQVPCAALPGSPTMAMPASEPPVSGSVNPAPNRVCTSAPAGDAASSSTAARVASVGDGASLTGVTTIVAVAAASDSTPSSERTV